MYLGHGCVVVYVWLHSFGFECGVVCVNMILFVCVCTWLYGCVVAMYLIWTMYVCLHAFGFSAVWYV